MAEPRPAGGSVGIVRLSLFIAIAVAVAAAVAGVAMQTPARPCGSSLPAGGSEGAAERVAEACALDAYETEQPEEVGGWMQLAPLIRNDRGLWEYAAFVWLDAPDAAPVAYELLLELRDGRWLVSELRPARGSAAVVPANSPT